MGNLGIPEIMVILVIVLLVFGPEKLPDMARQLGKGMSEIRRVQATLRADVTGVLGIDEDDDEPVAPFHPPRPETLSSPAVPRERAVPRVSAPSRFRVPPRPDVST